MPSIITGTRLRQQTLAMGQLGDSSTLSEVWDIDVSSLTADSYTVEADTSSPAIKRTRHATHTDFVCTRTTTRQISVGHWQHDADFTTRAGNDIYCRISRRGGTRMMDAWMYTAGTYPANGTTTWPPTTSVTGAHIDVFGAPRPVPSAYNDISIEVYYDRTQSACTYANAMYWPALWTAALNRRNSVIFIGYPVGQVAFLSFSEQLTEDPWVTATLTFRADQLYHLEQRVLPDIDGRILLGATSTWDTSAIMQATKSYWYQPYSAALVDFHTLHYGSFAELTTPTPTFC